MDNIFQRAKQEIDLISVLHNYGFELRKYPSGYRSNRCPACGPSPHRNSTRLSVIPTTNGYWIWHCFACGESGDVVKAIQYLEGFYSPADAAKWLLEETGYSDSGEKRRPRLRLVKRAEPVTPPEQSSERDRARLEVIRCLLRLASVGKGSRKRIWAYFIEQRKIPESVLRDALKRKLVYLLCDEPIKLNELILSSIDYEVLKEAELLKKGRVRNLILLRPIVSPFFNNKRLSGAQFRAIDPEVQPKTISLVATGMWWWRGENPAVAVVEGIIDMLSLVAMRWKGCILGLSGTGLADRAVQVLQGPLRGREIYLALDGDEAGREATKRILSSINAHVLQIPDSCDLNDLLKQGVRDWRELLEREVCHDKQSYSCGKAGC